MLKTKVSLLACANERFVELITNIKITQCDFTLDQNDESDREKSAKHIQKDETKSKYDQKLRELAKVSIIESM